LLHQLGSERIANASKDAIVTKSSSGALEIAAWNLVDPDKHGSTRNIDVEILHAAPDAHVSIQRVDAEHGNVLPHYASMGRPLNPTPEQVEKLNRETALPAAELAQLQGGRLKVELSPNSLVLIKVEP